MQCFLTDKEIFPVIGEVFPRQPVNRVRLRLSSGRSETPQPFPFWRNTVVQNQTKQQSGTKFDRTNPVFSARSALTCVCLHQHLAESWILRACLAEQEWRCVQRLRRNYETRVSQTQFSTDLWDGFNIVSQKTECGLSSVRDMLAFFKKRAQAEEEHGRTLIKLAKSAQSTKRVAFKTENSTSTVAESPYVL